MSALVVLASVSALRFITTTVASSAFDWKVEPVLLPKTCNCKPWNLHLPVSVVPTKKTPLWSASEIWLINPSSSSSLYLWNIWVFSRHLRILPLPKLATTKKSWGNLEDQWKNMCQICWPPILMEFSSEISGSSDDGTNCFSNPSTWS